MVIHGTEHRMYEMVSVVPAALITTTTITTTTTTTTTLLSLQKKKWTQKAWKTISASSTVRVTK